MQSTKPVPLEMSKLAVSKPSSALSPGIAHGSFHLLTLLRNYHCASANGQFDVRSCGMLLDVNGCNGPIYTFRFDFYDESALANLSIASVQSGPEPKEKSDVGAILGAFQ